MRHIMTAREWADHVLMCSHHGADTYNVSEQIAQVIEAMKESPETGKVLAANLTEPQRTKAIGVLLTLLACHEMAQDEREGALDEG